MYLLVVADTVLVGHGYRFDKDNGCALQTQTHVKRLVINERKFVFFIKNKFQSNNGL